MSWGRQAGNLPDLPAVYRSFASSALKESASVVADHTLPSTVPPDRRWFDAQATTWRDRGARMARWPDLVEATRFRMTRVVLAATHLDRDLTNNRLNSLRAFCQRCHMLHDRPQRWITYRERSPVGGHFLG
jgi:hypothetical protein